MEKKTAVPRVKLRLNTPTPSLHSPRERGVYMNPSCLQVSISDLSFQTGYNHNDTKRRKEGPLKGGGGGAKKREGV